MTKEEIQETVTRLKASDIKSDDEWMQDNEWDEIYKQEENINEANN